MLFKRALGLMAGVFALGVHFAAAQVSPAKIISGAGAPNGIYATPSEVLYSQPYCQTAAGTRVINSVDPATSAITLFATLPDEILSPVTTTPSLSQQAAQCAENYLAISTGLGSFLSFSGYVYVSAVVGGTHEILRYSPAGGAAFTVFASLPANWGNHGGVTFDTVGTFQNALIATGETGVIGYNAAGSILFQYPNPSPGTFILENATVVPMSYTPCPGCMLIAAENASSGSGEIFSLPPGAPTGAIPTPFSTAPTELEALNHVPPQACSIGGYSYFASAYHFPNAGVPVSTNGAILAYTSAQLSSRAGQILAPDEASGDVFALTAPNALSLFSNTGAQLEGATIVPCSPATGCTLTQGGYKNHFNSKILPLTLGSVSYTASQINDILQNNAIKGNGLLSLAHQLITAKLNIIYGAGPDATTQQAILTADALIGSLVVPPVGSGTLSTSATSGLGSILDAFNNRGPECSQ